MYCPLPDPYPDELLYSVIARNQIWNGTTAARDNIEQCYGLRSIIAVADLPCHMDRLVQRLPNTYSYSSEDFIRNHTLFPYYTAFFSATRRIEIMEHMKGNHGGSIHMKAGVMAGAVQRNHYFKYCPICVKESLALHGEPFWNRVHQTPGVEVCPWHAVWLKDSPMPVQLHYRERYLPADDIGCPEISESRHCEDPSLIGLSRDIDALYKRSEPLDPTTVHENFRRRLQSQNYIAGSHTLRLQKLRTDLLASIPDRLIQSTFCKSSKPSVLNRLIEALRNRGHASHPLYYLLIIRFLFGSFQNFLNDLSLPVHGYPCFNAASDHYGVPVITHVEQKRWRKNKDFWHFHCSCGFSYSAAKLTSEPQRIRVIQYGPLWEAKLKSLASEGHSIRSIARVLKADSKTVHLHLSDAKCHGTTFMNTEPLENPAYRQRWLQAIEEHPEYGVSKHRKNMPALYAWLYRNDREWLTQCSPKQKKQAPRNSRLDWMQRDHDILNQLRLSYDELLSETGKPTRITKNRLGFDAQSKAVLEQHLHRLPLCAAFLQEHCESRDQYFIRKIPWAVAKVMQEGYPPVKWRIVRALGRKSSLCPEVSTAIDAVLLKLLEV